MILQFCGKSQIVPNFGNRSIQRGVYSTVDDYSPLEAAIKIFPPAYISFITALAFHGAYFQYTDEIHVMGQASKRIDLPSGRPIIYHQLKKEMLLNQNGVYKHEGYWIASLERAICDTSYLEPSFVFENVCVIPGRIFVLSCICLRFAIS